MTLAAPFIRILIALGVAGALALACFWAGHSKGYASGQIECAKAQAKAAADSVAQASAAITATRKVEQQHEVAQQKAHVVYRTIIKRVHDDVRANPHYADCGLDADGVRLWNAASAGTLSGPVSSTDDGLRTTAAPSAAAASAARPEASNVGPPDIGIASPGGERGRATGEPR